VLFETGRHPASFFLVARCENLAINELLYSPPCSRKRSSRAANWLTPH
jgi:hypothetical protein